MLTVGEDVHVRDMWEIFVSPTQFCGKPKIALKSKSLKNRTKQNTWSTEVYMVSLIFNFEETGLH